MQKALYTGARRRTGKTTTKGTFDMDANVKVLMDTAGCTEAQAQHALNEGGNNLTRALELLDAAGKEVIVFQITFTPKGKPDAADKTKPQQPPEARGFLIVIFDLSKDTIVYSDLVYPLSREQAAMLDVNMPPTVYAKTMENAKGQLSERHRVTCTTNLSLLRSKLGPALIHKAIEFHNKSQSDKLAQVFVKMISDVYAEEFGVQYFARSLALGSISSLIRPAEPTAPRHHDEPVQGLFSDSDSNKSSPTPAAPDEIRGTSPQEAIPQIVLICEPELAPFAGKPARELIEGDEVIVKIKDGRESGRYFSELIGGSVGDELIPLLAPIVKLNKLSETFVEVFVEFGPGIYGQFFVPPDVKVKTKTENVQVYDPFRDDESFFADERYGRQILIRLTALIASVLLLIGVFIAASLIWK
jgi:hypothetical protein